MLASMGGSRSLFLCSIAGVLCLGCVMLGQRSTAGTAIFSALPRVWIGAPRTRPQVGVAQKPEVTWRSFESAVAPIDAKQNDSDLEEGWRTYDGTFGFDHWLNYAEHYQYHLPGPSSLRSQHKTMKLLEIGVQSGGSSVMWKKFYGETLYYVGVDIDPRCRRAEDLSKKVHVEIGSQMDKEFLESVCRKHGPFDVIIDDGGHTADMIRISMDILLTNPLCIDQVNGVYAVEDLHVLRQCKLGYCNVPSDISSIFAHLHEKMQHTYPGLYGPISMFMYRAVAFIEFGRQEQEERIMVGPG